MRWVSVPVARESDRGSSESRLDPACREYRQTHKQTDIQVDRQTDRRTDREERQLGEKSVLGRWNFLMALPEVECGSSEEKITVDLGQLNFGNTWEESVSKLPECCSIKGYKGRDRGFWAVKHGNCLEGSWVLPLVSAFKWDWDWAVFWKVLLFSKLK